MTDLSAHSGVRTLDPRVEAVALNMGLVSDHVDSSHPYRLLGATCAFDAHICV
jgi:hypothetical protein